MFENIAKFFKKLVKAEQQETAHSKDTAKERLHLVLMQDRANVSADFLELMKQEIIEVIKKYIEVDDKAIDVRLTNKVEDDGTNGSPFLYANIPIVKIKNEAKVEESNLKEEKDSIEKTEENKIEENKIEESKEKNKEEYSKEDKNKKIEDKEKQEEILQENIKEENTVTDIEKDSKTVENKEENKEKAKVVSKKKKDDEKPENKIK